MPGGESPAQESQKWGAKRTLRVRGAAALFLYRTGGIGGLRGRRDTPPRGPRRSPPRPFRVES